MAARAHQTSLAFSSVLSREILEARTWRSVQSCPQKFESILRFEVQLQHVAVRNSQNGS